MNYRAVFYYLGLICKIVCIFLVIPVIAALVYGEYHEILAFVYTAIIFLGVGFAFAPKAPKNKKLGNKEGLLTVGLSWILISLIGAFVFFFSGAIPNYFNAVFETASGFTTTGATILNEIESLPKSVLLWRSLTHWLGGMGILVFLLAVLPSSDGSTFQLMKFESPGPQVGKLVSKVRHSAAILYFIYFALTVLELIMLLFSKIGFYDSLNLALSTAGTGGFSVRNDSIAAYNSLYVEMVVVVFMLLFSVNFHIYYLIVLRKFATAFRDEEFRVYIVYLVLCVFGVALGIVSSVGNFATALRQSLFAVATLASSTGFTTVDFAQWSEASKGILTVVMLFGACAGSTGGGLKFSRAIVSLKCSYASLLASIRPNSVHLVKFNKKPMTDSEKNGITDYCLLFAFVLFGSVILLCLLGNNFSVSFYTALSMFNNMGPCLASEIGATASYASFNWGSKLVMILDMIIGRLEIIPVLMLFSPKAWSKKY